MHDAFEAAPILEKLPLKIGSITCYDDILLVGTKEGHLLQYKAKRSKTSGENKYDVVLEHSIKSFSKKPIQQLCAVPELFILISLSDSVVNVYDLATFGLVTSLAKTRGATLFATDVRRHVSLSGEVQATLQICVGIRRKLQLMYWKNRDFLELVPEMTVYDTPRAMTWCKDSLCVGFKRDYFVIKVHTCESKELFPLGSNQPEPIVTKLDELGYILGRDNMSIFVDPDGVPTKKHPLKWSDIPFSVVQNPPYFIAVLSKIIEIRTVDPLLMIQSIELSKARIICQDNGLIYIASINNVWRLNSTPIAYQIRQLLQNKEFELALHLANMTEEPENEKQQRINRIKTLYAVHLFCQLKFEDSMKLFGNLDTDLSHVIGLYPNLLPQEFRKQLEYPEKLPDLEGGALEKGLLALIDYLKDKRRELLKDKIMSTTAIKEGNKTVISKEQLGQIIDTTLLKCYLQTNDALVAPLLRLKDNKVHVEEAERSLKKKEKFSELIILYEKKGLHEKALSLLMKQAAQPNSALRGPERTVQYLQHLGADHLKLIFEFAEWVLKENPEEGLKIFTEDLTEVESLPRGPVLSYLERFGKGDKKRKDLAIPYLEHVIYHCQDTSEELHSRFAQLLREKVQGLMAEYLQQLPEGHIPRKPGMEPGDLGEYRRKLIDFLKLSSFYRPEELLPRFPMNVVSSISPVVSFSADLPCTNGASAEMSSTSKTSGASVVSSISPVVSFSAALPSINRTSAELSSSSRTSGAAVARSISPVVSLGATLPSTDRTSAVSVISHTSDATPPVTRPSAVEPEDISPSVVNALPEDRAQRRTQCRVSQASVNVFEEDPQTSAPPPVTDHPETAALHEDEALAAVRDVRQRATTLLKRGGMPLFPPARRQWDAEEVVTFSNGDAEVKWPPKGWKSLSAEQRLMAVEYAAMWLEFGRGMVTIANKAMLIDKYNFLVLPGISIFAMQEGSELPHKSRILNYEVLWKMVTTGQGDEELLFSYECASAARNTSTDDLIDMANGKGVSLRL